MDVVLKELCGTPFDCHLDADKEGEGGVNWGEGLDKAPDVGFGEGVLGDAGDGEEYELLTSAPPLTQDEGAQGAGIFVGMKSVQTGRFPPRAGARESIDKPGGGEMALFEIEDSPPFQKEAQEMTARLVLREGEFHFVAVGPGALCSEGGQKMLCKGTINLF